jgi:hypothetical protein
VTFWRSLLATIARNPISLFAVACVAATAAYLGWLTYRLLVVLESPAWCSKAIMAEKVSPGSTYVGLTTCVELLKIQLNAVATGFHISTGGFVFVLIVLIVVVVAGARASGKLGAAGLQFDVGRNDAPQAAQHVADEAQAAADEVKAEAPEPDDPAIPDYAKP